LKVEKAGEIINLVPEDDDVPADELSIVFSGMKIITQGIPGGTGKLLPKPHGSPTATVATPAKTQISKWTRCFFAYSTFILRYTGER
jgi:hypothetical protein